jgi:hypothetical protein
VLRHRPDRVTKLQSTWRGYDGRDFGGRGRCFYPPTCGNDDPGYVASQNPDDPGVLILSRFAGAARECQAALLVNPYYPDSVAVAIGRALSMPLGERRERHTSLFEVLSRNDVQYWAARFLGELEREPAPVNPLGQVPL